MKIFTRNQIAEIDRRTILEEPIPEIALMERASVAIADWITMHYPVSKKVAVFAGTGNNGGDAMAVARLLHSTGYLVSLFSVDAGRKRSECSEINFGRVKALDNLPVTQLSDSESLPNLSGFDLIIEGIYGSGLSRSPEGVVMQIIQCINQSEKEVVSIDLPAGLSCDYNINRINREATIRATYTLTLQFPKLSLFFAENEPFFGKWVVLPIGLKKEVMQEIRTDFNFQEEFLLRLMLKKRRQFSHKGTFGHCLLIGGSKGKMGAVCLASRGVLRSGAGLLTAHVPATGNQILQISVPEAMTSTDSEPDFIGELPILENYNSIAIGPGLGKNRKTRDVVAQLLKEAKVPLILDADALNILSENPELISLIPHNTILTPHPLEFSRLAGTIFQSDEERFLAAHDFALKHHLVLILKGAFTRIFLPDGQVWFNCTGNPGMSTGGSGDVLTGVLLGLLSQGYTAEEAALLGVFLHGKAADLYVLTSSEESLIAGDIADFLGKAFASLKSV